MLKNRKGIVCLPRGVFDVSHAETLRAFFSEFYPIQVEQVWYKVDDTIKYYGFSPQFRELKSGEVIPAYQATFDNGKVIFEEICEIKTP